MENINVPNHQPDELLISHNITVYPYKIPIIQHRPGPRGQPLASPARHQRHGLSPRRCVRGGGCARAEEDDVVTEQTMLEKGQEPGVIAMEYQWDY